MNHEKYMARFDATGLEEISLASLTELQQLHMYNIPFENLDVMYRSPIYLDLSKFYKKLVENHRGGFCYELNGLFTWLLKKLGYNARMVAGTVNTPDRGWVKKDSHVAIIVELDQPYLVDVGFGDSFRQPLTLDGKEYRDISGTYKIKLQSDHYFDLIRKEESANLTLYRFSDLERELSFFYRGCVFHQVSPDSNLTKRDMATIATKDGRITLTGSVLTITGNGEKNKKEVSDGEKSAVLKEYFGIIM
ncbi:arylamine N-acetyltransferase family protein [Evansella clarkii]|uniref:arylamine N-acetyltransferase family protein n=1 Tax=Evansella clarkii TaxID=79879 RepID=UPI000998BDDD|nr:arylamine N-acetyltransferase [Evansella clarkii]